ncbi:KTSC domain-containing protein [Rahnella victoriana]|uniref:KTSC domain-containing protein n=1 Tax=Rahnella victoriana TaxID=1510570 RepID=UPI000BB1DC60|nr:KTSC domain-containing protein [Rahnella victoriana]
MQRVNVVSSNILSIGYDPNTDTLEIEFLNGGIYEYYNVSQDIHIELMNAPSIGSYFNRNIRNNFPTQKL